MKDSGRFPRPKAAYELLTADAYTAEQRKELAGGEPDPSRTACYQLKWRPTEKHLFFIEGENLVCHLGLLRHTVEVQGVPVPVAGFGGLLVRKECRGRGYAHLAMHEAEKIARDDMGVEFVVFFCRPALQELYEDMGWTVITNTVWIDQPQGMVAMPAVSMVKCLGTERWPQGEVRLCSHPW